MQGLEAFESEHGAAPDIVMIATNYWDIAGLCAPIFPIWCLQVLNLKVKLHNYDHVLKRQYGLRCRFENGGYRFEGTPLEHRTFPVDWLDSWTQNFTEILTHLQVLLDNSSYYIQVSTTTVMSVGYLRYDLHGGTAVKVTLRLCTCCKRAGYDIQCGKPFHVAGKYAGGDAAGVPHRAHSSADQGPQEVGDR